MAWPASGLCSQNRGLGAWAGDLTVHEHPLQTPGSHVLAHTRVRTTVHTHTPSTFLTGTLDPRPPTRRL